MSNAVKLGAFLERISIGKEYAEILAATPPKRGSRRADVVQGRLVHKYAREGRTINGREIKVGRTFQRAHKEYKDSRRVLAILKAAGATIDNDDLSRGIK